MLGKTRGRHDGAFQRDGLSTSATLPGALTRFHSTSQSIRRCGVVIPGYLRGVGGIGFASDFCGSPGFGETCCGSFFGSSWGGLLGDGMFEDMCLS
jgi:hypothetical protein